MLQTTKSNCVRQELVLYVETKQGNVTKKPRKLCKAAARVIEINILTTKNQDIDYTL